MAEPVRHGVILAGGRSVRMGVDKAAVRVGGMMMLERVVRTVLELALPSEVMVVGRDGGPDGWPSDLTMPWVKFLADQGKAFAGPVGGVITALEQSRSSVLLLGCDMPLLTVRTLRALLLAHEKGNAAATMAVSQESDGSVFGEPMLSVYTPEILPRLQEMMRTGKKSLQRLLDQPGIERWQVPQDSAAELLNVNDPETLAQAERKISDRLQIGKRV